METVVLDGKLLSSKIEEDLKIRVKAIKEKTKIEPVLATILVGNDPSSEIYVNMKANACKRVGLGTKKIELHKNTTTSELLEEIDKLNKNENIFGILLQHPVPIQIDERACFNKISIQKDVDGVTAYGFGQMSFGEDVYISATPGGIMKLLKYYKIPLTGKKACIVGRSAILGKPIAMLLLNENATVTICHSKTENLEKIIRESDIVVAAIGKPEFIKSDWIKKGSVLIDAGYHKGGIGDVEKSSYLNTSAYTPVPGGVGPMTIATLLSQTVEAAEKALF
ncbi:MULTISPECIES: tetrahydrofolate dehydrogenase/cyclohydrolase catalytic domain-containing protein [unclassified Oceanispirochaeta]|uniref:tetrahydrofolate dehydrogenase/cyclohydrolase catalytic domain-containing protein n=1 Tax=unclassified Oceanispirochaeta TaxID=2635722 RepID=UPI000E08F1BE|nr:MULTISPECIES: tetrahydrofolate dehydrogenase/cyclohydrolase catalytic domain-containing protein [unclassified Oceanispirochaeta]MBF9018930.1 bifunctional 5,10-methylene-tetrahydrofolate dehydrogenase/5,10-methylene-tetrahydrofolate cyclohydrolase [Oceanispirochaeta sp. M2]NPD75429.1 bifunctional 5,10-methylene-tetrahydrofolate dehydrogenase/5,10-methylene-tetrahydrofolate cyclohydrolase [Oceanispirochaeta sp. M1]RDG28714.1 bifunctional 5,10-methylene-tetrahydrofolate dehydrogenase/5,10-methyl